MSGKFDYFQGGVGQKISYFDNTVSNNGTYRMDEYVDVEYNGESEGPTLGWIESGEWVEYTIRVGRTWILRFELPLYLRYFKWGRSLLFGTKWGSDK